MPEGLAPRRYALARLNAAPLAPRLCGGGPTAELDRQLLAPTGEVVLELPSP